jgi:hypothetical protein
VLDQAGFEVFLDLACGLCVLCGVVLGWRQRKHATPIGSGLVAVGGLLVRGAWSWYGSLVDSGLERQDNPLVSTRVQLQFTACLLGLGILLAIGANRWARRQAAKHG